MIQKYFPKDKNYLLKEAQDSTKPSLIPYLLSAVKEAYFQQFNPLRLEDPISVKIKRSRKPRVDYLEEFYEFLAAIYRFKFGENQLQILFDGRSHKEKYSEEWSTAFQNWIGEFCRHHNFITGTLELILVLPSDRNMELMSNRMKAFLADYFDIKIYKYKGIMDKEAA